MYSGPNKGTLRICANLWTNNHGARSDRHDLIDGDLRNWTKYEREGISSAFQLSDESWTAVSGCCWHTSVRTSDFGHLSKITERHCHLYHSQRTGRQRVWKLNDQKGPKSNTGYHFMLRSWLRVRNEKSARKHRMQARRIAKQVLILLDLRPLESTISVTLRHVKSDHTRLWLCQACGDPQNRALVGGLTRRPHTSTRQNQCRSPGPCLSQRLKVAKRASFDSLSNIGMVGAHTIRIRRPRSDFPLQFSCTFYLNATFEMDDAPNLARLRRSQS
jgi:hypothetical protein